MEHYYFFVIDETKKEVLVFYKNYDFLVVPSECFLVNVEDFDEREIIEMMLNGNELSDKRKEQFRRMLEESPERFNLDSNFPIYVGAGEICETIATIQNNVSNYQKKKYYAYGSKVLEFYGNKEIDLWGNVGVYERVNIKTGTDEAPPVLTKSERLLFAKLLSLKAKQPLAELKINSSNKVNFFNMGIFVDRNLPQIIEKSEIFKMLIRTLTKPSDMAGKFHLSFRYSEGRMYGERNARVYCEKRDKYFLGSLFLFNDEILKKFDDFLKLTAYEAYKEAINLDAKVIVLNRQETILLNALYEEFEKYLVIVPQNFISKFEEEVYEFLLFYTGKI